MILTLLSQKSKQLSVKFYLNNNVIQVIYAWSLDTRGWFLKNHHHTECRNCVYMIKLMIFSYHSFDLHFLGDVHFSTISVLRGGVQITKLVKQIYWAERFKGRKQGPKRPFFLFIFFRFFVTDLALFFYYLGIFLSYFLCINILTKCCWVKIIKT